MAAVPGIFRGRWLPAMRQEATGLRIAFPALLAAAEAGAGARRGFAVRTLSDLLHSIGAILPEEDFADAFRALDTLRARARHDEMKAA